MNTNAILNTIIISERIYTSGQPLPNQFQEIANASFTTVINLAMPDSDDALLDEGGLVSEAGMNYFHIPVPFDAPTKKHMTLFFKLMKAVEKEKVWIHCAVNKRVSAFMWHYQTHVMKRKDDKIIPRLEEWKPNTIWQDFLSIDKERRRH